MEVPVEYVLRKLPDDVGIVLSFGHIYYEDLKLKAVSVLGIPVTREGIPEFDPDDYVLVFDEKGNEIEPEWNPFKVEWRGGLLQVGWEDVPPYGEWIEWGKDRLNWTDIKFEVGVYAPDWLAKLSFPYSDEALYENMVISKYDTKREFGGVICVYVPHEKKVHLIAEPCYLDCPLWGRCKAVYPPPSGKKFNCEVYFDPMETSDKKAHYFVPPIVRVSSVNLLVSPQVLRPGDKADVIAKIYYNHPVSRKHKNALGGAEDIHVRLLVNGKEVFKAKDKVYVEKIYVARLTEAVEGITVYGVLRFDEPGNYRVAIEAYTDSDEILGTKKSGYVDVVVHEEAPKEEEEEKEEKEEEGKPGEEEQPPQPPEQAPVKYVVAPQPQWPVYSELVKWLGLGLGAGALLLLAERLRARRRG